MEKRFFDIAKREDEEIKGNWKLKSKMTEEENWKKKRHEAEVKELIRKAEARMKNTRRFPILRKLLSLHFYKRLHWRLQNIWV